MPLASEEDTFHGLGFVCALNTIEHVEGKRRIVTRGEEAGVWGWHKGVLVLYDYAKKPWIKWVPEQSLSTTTLHVLNFKLSDRRDHEQICIPHSDNPEAHDSFVRLFLPDADERLIIKLEGR